MAPTMNHLPNELLMQVMWYLDLPTIAKLAGFTSLHELATKVLYRKDVNMAQDLPLELANGPVPQAEAGHQWGSKALGIAASTNDTELIKRILAHGGHKIINYKNVKTGDVAMKYSYALTPLSVAALHGSTDLANLLINEGADVNGVSLSWDPEGIVPLTLVTPLGVAIRYRHNTTARALLRGGAGLEIMWEERLEPQCMATTALTISVTTQNVAMVTELLDTYNADVNATDSRGNTALHYGHRVSTEYEIVPKLLAAGANTQAVNRKGEIPLHRYTECQFNHVKEYIRILIDAGSNVNAQDHTDRTPLGAAGWNRNADALESLALTHGADLLLVSQTSRDAWSQLTAKPYDEATEYDNVRRCVAALIDAGIAIDQAKIAAFLELNCYQIPVLLRDHLREPLTANDWAPMYASLAAKTWETNKSIQFLSEFYPQLPAGASGENP
ncbi:ankyrin repeat protein [Paramyrothecium foliicola]|nr:ankyrin repeat protein [Paramyrothecium foliicola]